MMKSICFVTVGDMRENASAKRALGLAFPLVKLGWKVTIFLQDTKENRHQVSIQCPNNVHIIYYSIENLYKDIRFLKRSLFKLNPSVIYFNGLTFKSLFLIPKHCNVVIEHCELYSHYNELKFVSKVKALFFEFLSIFCGDALVVASRYLEKIYRKRTRLLFKCDMPILYLPYAYTNVNPLNTSILKLPEKRCTTFVYLGTIRKQYGIFTILDAANKLKNRYNFHIYILGSGKDLEEAQGYVNDHHLNQNIVFSGYVKEEDVPIYFSAADAFLSPMNDTPQDWARCPSKLYMYLPYMKPVITCKIGEPYEALKEEGLYYSPSNPDGLAASMEKVINGEKVNININVDDFSWDTSARIFDKWAVDVAK